MLVFGSGCGTIQHEGIGAWSMRGIESAIDTVEDRGLPEIGRGIFWNALYRSAKVELQLRACHGNNAGDGPPFYGNNDQL